MPLGDCAVLALLGVWALLSFFNQFEKGRFIQFLKKFDFAGAIPIWTFFAPNPGSHDNHLLFRDVSADGTTGPWREIHINRRPPGYFLFNPEKRVSKAVGDHITFLLRRAKPGNFPKRRMVEMPYLALLHFVSSFPADFLADRRQFAIARTAGIDGRKEPVILFLSAFHKLEIPDPELTVNLPTVGDLAPSGGE
jgi:hypothetical protein